MLRMLDYSPLHANAMEDVADSYLSHLGGIPKDWEA